MSTSWHLFSAACTKESVCEFMACLGTHDYGGVRALSLGTGQRVYRYTFIAVFTLNLKASLHLSQKACH